MTFSPEFYLGARLNTNSKVPMMRPGVDIAHFVATELNDPMQHSLEWQIGSFSSEAMTHS